MIPKWFQKIPKLVYYSPGDRAQKVIPGGTKTNESLWESQKDVKKLIIHFPSFLFTTALVIERKELSPEARKQTRASESLKMMSKCQLYVSHQTPHFHYTFTSNWSTSCWSTSSWSTNNVFMIPLLGCFAGIIQLKKDMNIFNFPFIFQKPGPEPLLNR